MPHGSLNAFKATLARKKARDVKKKSIYDKNITGTYNSDQETEYNFPKLTDSELENVKLSIRRKLKNDRRKSRILGAITLLILIILILSLMTSLG